MVQRVSFGDNVRVIDHTITRQLGIVDQVGAVEGQTTRFDDSIAKHGDSGEEYFINVYFEQSNKNYWLSPKLVVFVDFGVGKEITLDGVDGKWVRNPDGEWVQEP